MKVVIAGAGFGGLRLARKLSNKPGFEVVLIDRFNYHQFQPLFYQVATAGLDASNISFPLRKVFQKSKNLRIRLATVKEIIPAQKKILTDKEEIGYDVLVLATGADTNFFGNNQLAQNAFPMKSTVEALQIRHRLLQLFENAHTIKNPGELQRMMNIVVVGGGPTGVEVSGALAEMKKYVLPKDFPELDISKMNIYLLEGSGKTLSSMSAKASERSARYLEKLGVKLMTNSLVKDYNGQEVVLQNGEIIPSSTVIWAAGIKGNIPGGVDNTMITRGNRIKIDRCCRAIGHQDIYVLGDLACMETSDYPHGHPQVAPVAIQQADLIAHNLRLLERKANPERQLLFTYRDKGSMATVGRNLAVVDVPKPKLHFGGFFAWLVWMSLHLMLILGVKNRFFVFINWLYNYITYDQNLRLIFREFNRPENPKNQANEN
ncbi:MAG TPA: NAD(P)/FAD-dependent oxidoreductase [Chitinophagaceae bacterium]|nr:NAD(P)/FAD-dependent oxidoreductase [Chitinophagaceae bacterium]